MKNDFFSSVSGESPHNPRTEKGASPEFMVDDSTEVICHRILETLEAVNGFVDRSNPVYGYLDQIATKLLANRSLPNIIILADSNIINAFALPNGTIILTPKVLKLCKTEDEIAFLFAHEYNHIEEKHGEVLEQYAKPKSSISDFLKIAGISRIQEYESDIRPIMSRLGTAGFQPTAGATFLHALKEEVEDRNSLSHGSLRDRELNIYSLEKIFDLEGIENAQTAIDPEIVGEIDKLVAQCNDITPIQDSLEKASSLDQNEIRRLAHALKLEPKNSDYLILSSLFSKWYQHCVKIISDSQKSHTNTSINVATVEVGMKSRIPENLLKSQEFVRQYRALMDTFSAIETNLYDQISDNQERIATLSYILLSHMDLPLLNRIPNQNKRFIEFFDFKMPSGNFLYTELLDLLIENGFKTYANLVRHDVISSLGMDIISGSAENIVESLSELAIELESYQDQDDGIFDVEEFFSDFEAMINCLDEKERSSSGIGLDKQNLVNSAVIQLFKQIDPEFIDADKLLNILKSLDCGERAYNSALARTNPERNTPTISLRQIISSLTDASSDRDFDNRETEVATNEMSLYISKNYESLLESLEQSLKFYNPDEAAFVYLEFFVLCRSMQHIYKFSNDVSVPPEFKNKEITRDKTMFEAAREIYEPAEEANAGILEDLSAKIFIEYLKYRSSVGDEAGFIKELETIFRNYIPGSYKEITYWIETVTELGFDEDNSWLRKTYLHAGLWMEAIKECNNVEDTGESFELYKSYQDKYGENAINHLYFDIDKSRSPETVRHVISETHNLLKRYLAQEDLTVEDRLSISRLICDPEYKNLFMKKIMNELIQLDFDTLYAIAKKQSADIVVALACYEILIEHKASTTEEFQQLLDDLENILQNHSEVIGKVTFLDAIADIIGDSYKTIAETGIKTRKDDTELKEKVVAYWHKLLKILDLVNDLDYESVAGYTQDENEVLDWLETDSTEALFSTGSLSGLSSLDNSRFSSPAMQMALSDRFFDRLYLSGNIERQAIARKLLSDPKKGLLDRREQLIEVLQEIINNHISVPEESQKTIEGVLESVILTGDEKSIYFLISPFAARSLFRRPETPAPLPQVIYDFLKQKPEYKEVWEERYENIPDSLFLNRWTDPDDTRHRKRQVSEGWPVYKSFGDLATERFCRTFIPSRDEDDIFSEKEILKDHIAETSNEDIERIPLMRAIVELATILGAPGVRFLQVLGQYIDIPDELKSEFSAVFDNTFGQSRLAAYSLIKREYPQLFSSGYKLGERIGGGSLVSVYSIEGDSGKKGVARVLNPNAAYRAKESIDLIQAVISDLLSKDKTNDIYLLIQNHLLPDLERWIMADLKDQNFEQDDLDFSKWDGFKPSESWDYAIKIPKISPTENRFVQIEEFIEGSNLTQLKIVEHATDISSGAVNSEEYREMVALIIQHYFQQINDGQIHSDAHEGNFRLTPSKQIAILDRNNYIRLDEKDKNLLQRIFAGNIAEGFVDYLLAHEENSQFLDQRESIIEQVKSNLSFGSEDIASSIMNILQGIKAMGLKTPLKITLLIKNLSFLNNIAKKANFSNITEALFFTK